METENLNKVHIHIDIAYIIDDDVLDIFIVEKNLGLIAEVGEVRKYMNAMEALAELKKIKDQGDFPSHLFLDVKMPVLNGLNFLREFYKLPNELTQNCKIILLSAYFRYEEELEHLSEKFPSIQGCIEKPLDTSKLSPLLVT